MSENSDDVSSYKLRAQGFEEENEKLRAENKRLFKESKEWTLRANALRKGIREIRGQLPNDSYSTIADKLTALLENKRTKGE